MSWFDILKQRFYNTPKADAIQPRNISEPFVPGDNTTNWKDKLTPEVQAKIAADRKRFGETMASIPRQELKIKRPPSTGPNIKQEILDREQRKLDEAWAEKQRELQTQRSSATNARIDQLNQTLDSTKRDVKILLSKIKQKQAQGYQQLADNLDRQKFENVKNKLKEAGLNNLLAQVEAVENMAEGRFSE